GAGMELRPGTKACRCPDCSAYFASPSAFDFHRTGPAHDRKCQDPEAIGMTRNAGGYWIIEAMPTRSTPAWKAPVAFGKRLGGAIQHSEGAGTGRAVKGPKVGVLG